MSRSRPSLGAVFLSLFGTAALLSCVDPGASIPSAIRSSDTDGGGTPGILPVDPCLDGDGDGFGVACLQGPDCDDQDPTVTNQCTACLRPNEGCPCPEGAPPQGCNVATGDTVNSPEGICRLGQRLCRNGRWSACLPIESNARFIAPSSACYGMCDPFCRHFVECPEPSDAVFSDSTDVTVSTLPLPVFCPSGLGLGGIQPRCDPRPGDNYVRSTSPAMWIEACSAAGRTIVLPSQDEATATVSLPFTFAYWGIPYNSLQVTPNGVLQFANTISVWVNTTLPAPAVPNAIFPFWDDLVTRTGVCVATVGTAPNRRAVFQWDDASTWPSDPATHLTFEVILGERDQTIDILYRRLDGPSDRVSGSSATIGLQQSIGTRFDLVSFNSPNAVTTSTALRWSPDSNALFCRQGSYRRTFNATCAPVGGVGTVPVWGRLNYSALVPPGSAIRLWARAADTAAGLLTAPPVRLPDAPTVTSETPLVTSIDVGDILHASMRGLAFKPFLSITAEFDPGPNNLLTPRLGGLELQYQCRPVEDPYRCSAGSPCQLSNPCRRGVIICPYSYGSVCQDIGALPPGTSCAPGSVCNAAGNCVPCAEGAACDTGNACTFGRISCATGAPVCTVAGNRPPGTPCDFASTGNYTRGTSPLGFIEACNLPGAQRILTTQTEGIESVTLPFPFRFYGTQQTTMGVSVNGAVGFPTITSDSNNLNLPSAALGNGIFPFWDDLQTRPTGICTATVGSAPDRLFIVQWSNVDLQDRGIGGDLGASLNFEVILAEATQAIHVLYGDMLGDGRASGSSATIGIQQAGGARYDRYAYNTTGAVLPHSSILWTPPSTSSCTGTGVCSPCTLVEVCDGIDNNCNGLVDDGIADLTCGVGACRRTVSACIRGAAQTCTPGTPSPEVCNGIDDNCNGSIDESCMGTITCPGNASMFAGDTRSFTVTTGGMLRNITWSVVSAPTGGASSVVWSPAPPTALTENFRPIIVGVYRIRVQGTDGLNQMRSCEFEVTANSRGIRTELTWNGTGDVDLHMHNNVSGAWFHIPNDCHYRNMNPAWGAGLDVDNVTANGPENIRINTPTIGQTYTVGVHNYARAAGRIATVRIYCGATAGTTPSAVYNSTPLAGTSSGNCTANTWWDVAHIVVNADGSCTITPINTYRTSSAACSTR